jgi:predicted RecA/RadA family phage recombinase
MKNAISDGKVLEYTAPSGGVVSGGAYLIGSLLVVATASIAQALKFEGKPAGVFDLPKATDDAFSEGLKLYWDDSAKKITTTSGGNTLVGVAMKPIVPAVVELETDADPSDLLIDGLTLQVLDFAQLASDDATVTVTVNGIATVLIEGTDWTAETDDETTATNLAAAIAALAGVKAIATDDTVTVVPATGVTATELTTGRVRLDGAAR